MTPIGFSMTGITVRESGDVLFTVPFIRAWGAFAGGFFVLAGVIYFMIASVAPVNWGALVFAILFTVASAGLLVALTKGYMLSVRLSEVVCHKLVNRRIPIGEIASVELVKAMARLGQPRTCLEFHLVDGQEYLYKLFTGSTSPGSKSYTRVEQAKVLIDQRIAATRGGVPAPPPPPVPAPPGPRGPSHGYGDPGGPLT